MMPTLTQTDLARYFAAGTGTRWWVGIKVFKNPGGTNRWWAGHASRRIVNGQFQNVADISPESMPIVQTNNVDLNIPTPVVFHIHVSTLIHPCAAPANYPATLDINLEDIRQLIVSLL
jgi:formylmethanofuran dehydrogenase subunit A